MGISGHMKFLETFSAMFLYHLVLVANKISLKNPFTFTWTPCVLRSFLCSESQGIRFLNNSLTLDICLLKIPKLFIVTFTWDACLTVVQVNTQAGLFWRGRVMVPVRGMAVPEGSSIYRCRDKTPLGGCFCLRSSLWWVPCSPLIYETWALGLLNSTEQTLYQLFSMRLWGTVCLHIAKCFERNMTRQQSGSPIYKCSEFLSAMQCNLGLWGSFSFVLRSGL